MFDRVSLQTDEFSWSKALSLALASQLAYQKKVDSVTYVAIKTWGFSRCETFGVADTQGFVAWDSKALVISFRGTECPADWLSDLDVCPEVRPYGVVYRAFFNAFAAAQPLLVSILNAAGPSDRKVWITGHSLGGALAMIAGAELADSVPVSGFYTYGQPRTGNGQVRSYFQQRFSGKFQRIFNADDIVPKVPPGYTHVGRLLWFDDQGDLKPSSAETAVGAENKEAVQEPPEMSEAEFREFQRELKSIKAATGSQTKAFLETAKGQTGTFEASAEGIFPSISGHDLARYIRRIRRYAEDTVHVDGILEQAIAADAAARAGLESLTRSTLRSKTATPVLLRVKNSRWQPPAGMKVQSRLGTIITAQCSLDQIEQLRQDRDVVSIEASREGGVAELSVSLPFVNATEVHVPPFDERGDSAIVAVIDAGIDVSHEAFRDAAGQTRIVALWHQNIAANGRTPKAVDPVTYTQDYGRLFLSADIQQMIANPAQTPAELRDALPPAPHGTHVASIAAGRAVGPFVGGLAPEAKIVVVIPDMVTEPGSPPSIGYSNSHVDALSFIRAIAEKLNLPVAVNVSLGMNAGAHDGSSSLEAAFDQFSGIGRDPGFVVIKSAGNERGYKGHAAASVTLGSISKIKWDSQNSIREQDYIEVWWSEFDDIAFTLVDPAGSQYGPVSPAVPQVSSPPGENHCQLSLTRSHRDNGHGRLVIQILPDKKMIQPGEWTLEMNGLAVFGGEVHAWVERDASRAVKFSSGDNDEMTLSIPGTASTVITVAACEATDPVRLVDSSSWGLTRDRRAKPDICAPGKNIVAARGNTGQHDEVIAMTGTSMAAPHVTGAVALVLSRRHKKNAQVNALQVRAALIRTARNFTGRHDKGFGYGVLNVRDFLNQF